MDQENRQEKCLGEIKGGFKKNKFLQGLLHMREHGPGRYNSVNLIALFGKI